MDAPSCPACAAPADRQTEATVDDGERVWVCWECGCIRQDARFWWNLTEAVLDPMPNDGWMGASGAELRDDHYETYPHAWDWDLKWCRISAAMDSGLYSEMFEATQPGGNPRDVMDIPAWIIRRALVALPERYRQRDIF